MKHYSLYLLFVLLFLSLCPQNIFADRVHVKGGWGDNIIRSIVPKAPEVHLNENILSVYTADALSDLIIKIVDVDGVVIWEEHASTFSGESIAITLDKELGCYKVVLVHAYGCLSGEFTLE